MISLRFAAWAMIYGLARGARDALTLLTEGIEREAARVGRERERAHQVAMRHEAEDAARTGQPVASRGIWN